jgi:lipopolysaccharide/colanic/teichoic acid biosynthesis glycosyltransferase
VVAAALGVALAPVVAAAAVAVRRTSPGGAFVGLDRVGRGGRPFRMWKLRSMRAASADRRAGGSLLTAAGDQRVTPVGRWLRRWRLDELPQLWHVVRGDMALLGPRPETPEYVDADDPRWRAALAVRPGIAGPTQVMVHRWEAQLDGDPAAAYRAEVLPVKLAIDGWYAARATPALDALVVAGLVQSMLGRERTVLHPRVEREVPEAARIPRPGGAP